MDKTPIHQKWLKRAKSNLVRAKQPKPEEVYYEDLCYDAQQSVEKSFKAVLCFHNIKFRLVHDIGELIYTLDANDVKVPEEIKDASKLTNYAVETRYPSPYEPVTEDEFNEAINLAEKVYNWAEKIISQQTLLPF